MGLKSNKYALEELLRSPAWADLNDVLKERINRAVDELEYSDLNEDVWISIRRVTAAQARLGELRFLEALPRFMMEHYEDLAKIEEGEKDGRSSG